MDWQSISSSPIARACAFSLLLMLLGPAPLAQADEIEAKNLNLEAADVALLDQAITEAYQTSKRPRRMAGWTSITAGVLVMSIGVWRFVADNDDNNEFQRGLGVMFLSLGGAELATGATLLSRGYQEEDRYRRWRASDPEQLGSREIARYEGELRALAYVRERERRVLRWMSLTRMIVGGLMMSLVPVPDLNKASRRNGFVAGGIFAATGAFTFGLSFRESEAEKVWKSYQARSAGLR